MIGKWSAHFKILQAVWMLKVYTVDIGTHPCCDCGASWDEAGTKLRWILNDFELSISDCSRMIWDVYIS